MKRVLNFDNQMKQNFDGKVSDISTGEETIDS